MPKSVEFKSTRRSHFRHQRYLNGVPKVVQVKEAIQLSRSVDESIGDASDRALKFGSI